MTASTGLYSFADLLALATVTGCGDADTIPALMSRLKNFIRVGALSPGAGSSKGRATTFTRNEVLRVAVLCELANMGFPPERSGQLASMALANNGKIVFGASSMKIELGQLKELIMAIGAMHRGDEWFAHVPQHVRLRYMREDAVLSPFHEASYGRRARAINEGVRKAMADPEVAALLGERGIAVIEARERRDAQRLDPKGESANSSKNPSISSQGS